MARRIDLGFDCATLLARTHALSIAATRRDNSKLREAVKRRWERPEEREKASLRTLRQFAFYGHPRMKT